MAKFRGRIGYVIREEEFVEIDGDVVGTGKWIDHVVEKYYSCELVKNVSKWQVGESINDDIDVTTQVSILADAFAYDNYTSIRYIEYMGSFWKVTSIEVQRPRLILSTGGVWNGTTLEISENS